VPEIKKELDEYKKFAFNKNLMALALALILATVIQKFVSAISESLLMPIINYFVSAANPGNWRDMVLCPVDGMNLEIGKLCAAGLEFTITTIVLYVIYSKIVKRFNPDAELEEYKKDHT
jgi:large-conductance mechanosensitive channel